jgi:hypothetical protein
MAQPGRARFQQFKFNGSLVYVEQFIEFIEHKPFERQQSVQQ